MNDRVHLWPMGWRALWGVHRCNGGECRNRRQVAEANVTDLALTHLRRLLIVLACVTWLIPLVQALTALVLAWTSAAGDPIGLAR